MKTLKVIMEIDVEDLLPEERADCAKLDQCEPDELPDISEIETYQMADCVEVAVMNYEEMFAGSGLYAKVAAVRITDYDWKL